MKPELMAPAGSFETLQAAINAGADSVYFGVGPLNMRARAANFGIKDLPKIVEICKDASVRSYLTLNTVIYDSDLDEMKKIADLAKEVGITAVIATDISVIQYLNKIGMRTHISTQANVSNIEAVKFYSQYADVIILARELTLDQIKSICAGIKKEKISGPNGELVAIEVFIHGALCVSIAGKCYMSLATYNQSANRGSCLQNCRRSYRVTDDETGDELVVDNKYVMSPKDLCTIGILDKLIDAGASIFKIEGRGRKADYVDTVVRVYKDALKSIEEKKYTQKKIDTWTKELEKVYNRGFWQGGYYLGKKLGEWSGVYGSKSTEKKVYVGKGLNYYQKNSVGMFSIETGEVKVGDDVMITGPTTGLLRFKVEEIMVNDKKVDCAKKGDEVTIAVSGKIRASDKLFVIKANS
ncbi:MAG: U32 family peptidase [Nanoarchaeota archaeon]|nr:U32 family peptidase [Nanoarchaeota archaeon]